ncbi:protein FAM241B-like [Saccostrea cucullata]|uniref:protein FAM241B-like n=1 Tax=Saccostrea cuccullata TaxID=36930 RepID=UPI002ED6A505
MVRILSNGDIVPDDDPRAQQAAGNRGSNSPRPRQGFVQHDSDQQPGAGRGFLGQGDGQVSVFTLINQKLLDLGIPRFSVGPYVVEPIATVGMILATLLFGLPGLLFGAVLFLVVMSSQATGQAGGQRRAAGGGGHRLG